MIIKCIVVSNSVHLNAHEFNKYLVDYQSKANTFTHWRQFII
ncbi:hypothetical protein A1OE_810 [Candidatus Endolissoclinum faulkneri L2]|uniref:Uncharacterized protein n=1 Tax=Candidatus Endolissoclinum faulkneri L2 TaxID=1193729 RepID=K7YHG5_9PROT|nr:hypothetical protein A1OE_810 [Candidatus Endolissoclinum faulkneri L2]